MIKENQPYIVDISVSCAEETCEAADLDCNHRWLCLTIRREHKNESVLWLISG